MQARLSKLEELRRRQKRDSKLTIVKSSNEKCGDSVHPVFTKDYLVDQNDNLLGPFVQDKGKAEPDVQTEEHPNQL